MASFDTIMTTIMALFFLSGFAALGYGIYNETMDIDYDDHAGTVQAVDETEEGVVFWTHSSVEEWWIPNAFYTTNHTDLIEPGSHVHAIYEGTYDDCANWVRPSLDEYHTNRACVVHSFETIIPNEEETQCTAINESACAVAEARSETPGIGPLVIGAVALAAVVRRYGE